MMKDHITYHTEQNQSRFFSILILILIALVLVGFTSCVSQKKFEALQKDKEELETELAKTKVDNEVREYEFVDQVYDKTNDIYLKTTELIQKSRQLDSLEQLVNNQKNQLYKFKDLVNEVERELWKVEEVEGRLLIDLNNEILFDVNSNDLSKDGMNALKEIADALTSLDEEAKVWVVGHTDDQSYPSEFKDNWDLSTERAVAVVKALVQNGLAPESLVAAGRGQFDPRADNTTAEGRASNRRTEIIVVPRYSWDTVTESLWLSKF
jgi:chemotaxis protein MotB